jgi:hypothetical protein
VCRTAIFFNASRQFPTAQTVTKFITFNGGQNRHKLRHHLLTDKTVDNQTPIGSSDRHKLLDGFLFRKYYLFIFVAFFMLL